MGVQNVLVFLENIIWMQLLHIGHQHVHPNVGHRRY